MFQFSLKNLRFINYFLLLMILLASLFMVRTIITSIAGSGTEPGQNSQADASDKETTKNKGIIHYASIVEKNPFGTPMKFSSITSPGLHEPEHAAEEISLNGLTLIGTVVGPDELSYAIFKGKSPSSSSRQEVFAHGENVYDYGVLTEILPFAVKLTLSGKVYTIQLIESGDAGKTSGGMPKVSGSSKAPFSKKVGRGKYQLDRRQVQQSIENPERILTDARLLPNFKDGKQEGFIISEVVRGGLYENLGIRNGDILLNVNNLEISNPEVAIQAMSTLKGTNDINLDIIRNGKKISLDYKIR
jgi:general secretion pathway protein C